MARTIIKTKYTNFDGLQNRLSNLLQQKDTKISTKTMKMYGNAA